MLTARTSKSLCRGGGPSVSSSLPSCSTSSSRRCGNRYSFSHLASIARRQEHKTQYYVATLPWANKEDDRKERFNDLVKNARLAQNDQIVASSITTSKRASPIASSLKAEIEHINSTANRTGGGAWLLLKAENESQASDILKQLKMDQVFNMDKSTIEAVHLEQETEAGGPLYTNSNSDAKSSSSSTGPSSSSSSSSSSQDGIAQEEVSAGDAPETVFRDTSSGENENTSSGADKTQKSPKENAAHAENVSTGGHSVETNGPLYGK